MKTDSKKIARVMRAAFVLLAGILLVPAVRAQPVTANVENRLLLVFETSSDMKKRLPALQKALDAMFLTSLNGQLHASDSVGVWTFDQDLHTGQFPLQHWQPASAAETISNIVVFVGKQRYSKKASFDALQPSLNAVVQNSERLTVLIFCDGEEEIGVTPFDSGINRVFEQKQGALKKARQPFIIVLRSQFGEYAGCTVNFPPAPVNLPQFPPLPTPPAPVVQTPPPPPAVVPSLIIIGKSVGTNPPPPVEPAKKTNMISAPPQSPPALTNTVTQTNTVVRTNSVAAPAENPDINHDEALAVGATLLAVAGALIIWILRRVRRRDHSSLITRSMNDRK
jgi:hypothetical protein